MKKCEKHCSRQNIAVQCVSKADSNVVEPETFGDVIMDPLGRKTGLFRNIKKIIICYSLLRTHAVAMMFSEVFVPGYKYIKRCKLLMIA